MPATCLEAQDGVQDEFSMQPDEGKKVLETSAPACLCGTTLSCLQDGLALPDLGKARAQGRTNPHVLFSHVCP